MAVLLDHMIVPAKERKKAAELLARLLDVPWSEAGAGPFCAVYVNDGLTLDFDEWQDALPVQHYCFRMSETEFDRLLGRLQLLGIAYRSTPHGPNDSQVNTAHGGRILYWSEPDGHVWEALTVSYARKAEGVPPRDAPPEATAAACRYLLVGLLQRLDRIHPGLMADVESGVKGDRDAMLARGAVPAEVQSAIAEALRMLDLAAQR